MNVAMWKLLVRFMLVVVQCTVLGRQGLHNISEAEQLEVDLEQLLKTLK